MSSLAFETNFETALKAVLTASGLVAFTSREDGELPATRIVAEATGFAQASNHRAFNPQGVPVPDHYAGQLSLQITTPRTVGGSAAHDAMLIKVRELMAYPRRAFGTLPYTIVKIEPTGGAHTYIKDGERDRSELPYTVEFGVPGALL